MSDQAEPPQEDAAAPQGRPRHSASWSVLLHPSTLPALAVLLSGILLHSVNVLLLATVMPSIVAEIRGEALIAWPTTAYLASSIVATTMTGRFASRFGAARTFGAAAFVFAFGAGLSALAPTMGVVVAGRFLQGFGGGLLSALAYVLARRVFPADMRARVLAVMTSVWSVSALVGPFVGGLFATYGSWRSAFLAVAMLAVAVGVGALWTLPAEARDTSTPRAVPVTLIVLVVIAIACMSGAAIAASAGGKITLIAAALVAMATMVWRNAASSTPLLPTDAFQLSTQTGSGLWAVLLVSMSFSPVHIYVPVLLQKLHGFVPLAAGYAVALAALAWTVVAVVTAPLQRVQVDRLLMLGPVLVAAGLLALAATLGQMPAVFVLIALAVVGAGMGAAWSFIAERVMAHPRGGEGDVAASSVATVQQVGFALGSALSGIIANMAGFSLVADRAALIGTATMVPMAFAGIALLAACAGWWLGRFDSSRPT